LKVTHQDYLSGKGKTMGTTTSTDVLGALSRYSGVPRETVERMTSMPAATLAKDAEYLALLKTLNISKLESTLQAARDAVESGLPAFIPKFYERTGWDRTPMSSYTLGNWLVGFLEYPEQMPMFIDLHGRLPRDQIRDLIPELISVLDNMGDGGPEWQKAMALMSFALATSS
jgi:hypothetical protein